MIFVFVLFSAKQKTKKKNIGLLSLVTFIYIYKTFSLSDNTNVVNVIKFQKLWCRKF